MIVRFNDITICYDKLRRPLSKQQRQSFQGSYPYFGAQGIIDYVQEYLLDGKYLLLAEDGENLVSRSQDIARIVKGKFWVNNHAHVYQTTSQCNIEFLCHVLNNASLNGFVTGAAQPKLSQESLNHFTLDIPDKAIQDQIMSIVKPIDDRILNNLKINDNLVV